MGEDKSREKKPREKKPGERTLSGGGVYFFGWFETTT
jgi:hypothetical protein